MRWRYGLALACVALAVSAAGAEPPKVEVPAEVIAAGDYVFLTPKTTAKGVSYKGLSGVDPMPAALLKDPTGFVLYARNLEPGTYKFWGVASLNDEHTPFAFSVVIPDGEGRKPKPPKPPTPPTPPTPPVPPAPSALVKLLSDAYGAEPAVDKRERVRALSDVMAEGAKLATTVDNSAVLASEVVKKRTAAIGDALPAVRKAVGAYIGGELGLEVIAFNATNRAKVAAAYQAVSDALKEVGR